ncbi:YcgL domain-containing protein [Marinobacter sp. SS21]|uniref:YcgL domain-containing protein n=1 Tax=Marinobacter sp. SS21 TaxID=2979460 RepID=UPI00232E144A|nr:YcgL domain-containing protein [Marinobacter sp. SS21]MDC0661923.1 YcgL domain-containing protein [Marinobacter sp. SS21]
MKDKQFVSVFRSGKKDDTYIYVRRGQAWDELPEPLRTVFGEPVHAVDLILTPDRKLARTSGKAVLVALEEQGFYLQMPEEQESYIVEFKEKLRKPRQ